MKWLFLYIKSERDTPEWSQPCYQFYSMMNYAMTSPNIQLCPPDWLGRFMADHQQAYTTVEARMRLVIELARLNIEHQTGGPFGAAIFNMETHKLVSAGVNLVVPTNCSMAHAR